MRKADELRRKIKSLKVKQVGEERKFFETENEKLRAEVEKLRAGNESLRQR